MVSLAVVTTVDAGASYATGSGKFGEMYLAEQKHNPWAMPPANVNPNYQQPMFQGREQGSNNAWPKFVTPQELKALQHLPESDSYTDNSRQPLGSYGSKRGYEDLSGPAYGSYGDGVYRQQPYGGFMGMPGYMLDPYTGNSNDLMFGPYNNYTPFGDSSGFPSQGLFPMSY